MKLPPFLGVWPLLSVLLALLEGFLVYLMGNCSVESSNIRMRIRNSSHPKSLYATLFLGASFFLAPISSVLGQDTIESPVDIPALLDEGDAAYQNSNYKNASDTYLKIIQVLENQSGNDAFRLAIKERYAQAGVEQAKRLSNVGAYDQAKELLASVSKNGVEHYAPAKELLEKLDDPIRSNPSLSKEHTDNVIAVSGALRKAEGAFELADYDKAERHYRYVLRIDPHNRAVRRGLERVAVTKSDYYEAAQDEARARMLSEVDAQWELESSQEDSFSDINVNSRTGAFSDNILTILQRARAINIPLVDLEDVNLPEAIEALREYTRQYDTSSSDPSSRGIDFIVNLGAGEKAESISNSRFDLQLRNIPALKVLDYITQITNTSYRAENFAIIIRPLTSTDEGALVSRSWRVPPDFLSRGEIGSSGEGNDDPFAETEKNNLPKRLTAKEFLESNGVTFPDGASAGFVSNSSQLIVRNTTENLDLVDQVVTRILQEDPVMVKVDVKLMTINQEVLTELGFDWLIGGGNIGSVSVGGGTQGNGGDLSDVPATVSGLAPITSGNRSGSGAIRPDSINSLINAANTGGLGSSSARAPGVLSVRGALNGLNFATMLRALSQSGSNDVVAVPSVIVKSGQTASVRMIREIIYPTEYEPPEVPDTNINNDDDGIIGGGGFGQNTPAPASIIVTPSSPTSFETRETGTVLTVNPVAGPYKKYINVNLNPSITEFEGFVNYGSPIRTPGIGSEEDRILTENQILMPIFSNLNVNTSPTILDGATIVLGGLQQMTRDKIEDKTPLLGSLPVIGKLFTSEVDRTLQRTVVIFVTVNLLDASGRPVNP